MSEVATQADILDIARRALLDESGAALVTRHGGTGDPLFTPEGFGAYAEDLMARMLNPFLHDQVDRVTRDPRRKLAYDDRLIGAMRLALEEGIEPRYLAAGAAAAASHLVPGQDGATTGPARLRSIEHVLVEMWGDAADDHRSRLIELICTAARGL